MSIDGVSENNSTSRSLEIMSLQFENCKEVYTCIISRPEVFQKKEMKENFQAYLSMFLDEMEECSMKVRKLVVDAPERATLRRQKMHGGYFSCDLCTANPENVRIPNKRGSKLAKKLN